MSSAYALAPTDTGVNSSSSSRPGHHGRFTGRPLPSSDYSSLRPGLKLHGVQACRGLGIATPDEIAFSTNPGRTGARPRQEQWSPRLNRLVRPEPYCRARVSFAFAQVRNPPGLAVEAFPRLSGASPDAPTVSPGSHVPPTCSSARTLIEGPLSTLSARSFRQTRVRRESVGVLQHFTVVCAHRAQCNAAPSGDDLISASVFADLVTAGDSP